MLPKTPFKKITKPITNTPVEWESLKHIRWDVHPMKVRCPKCDCYVETEVESKLSPSTVVRVGLVAVGQLGMFIWPEKKDLYKYIHICPNCNILLGWLPSKT